MTNPSGGVSKVQLDPQLLNTLLATFVSKPGGPQISFEEGQLRVKAGGHSVAVNPVSMQQVAQASLQAGALGQLNLNVDLVELGQQGLEIQLRLV